MRFEIFALVFFLVMFLVARKIGAVRAQGTRYFDQRSYVHGISAKKLLTHYSWLVSLVY